MKNQNQILSFPVLMGGLVVTGGLLIFAILLSNYLIPQASTFSIPTAEFTVVSGPTQTSMPSSTPELVITIQPTQNENGFGAGIYVQIEGTGGDGLRFRSLPGINSETIFVAFEPEVFLIQSGPENGDGYVWWYLAAPYDPTRVGWAAESFLAPIGNQAP